MSRISKMKKYIIQKCRPCDFNFNQCLQIFKPKFLNQSIFLIKHNMEHKWISPVIIWNLYNKTTNIHPQIDL